MLKSPLLFIGHGNPMYALESNNYTNEWQKIGRSLTKPNAIICFSAHWETSGTFITAMNKPRTIHDFGGFPQALFNLQYPCPGDPDLALNMQEKIGRESILLDQNWGLDHGTWSFLIHMFPDADIPVLQISLDRKKSFYESYKFAQQLNYLRSENILFIASGNIVHHLGLIEFNNPIGADWANLANAKIKEAIINKDLVFLTNILEKGKEFNLAIPSREHYLPLLYILGLMDEQEKITFFNDKLEMSSISMTSFITKEVLSFINQH
jgi:4,5-DOPA dioxygenase extradiol